MYKNFYITILFLLILSCQTLTKPIVYENKNELIDKEVQLIHLLIKNDNFEEANAKIENDLKLYPNNLEILTLRGWLLLKENNLQESEKLFKELLDEQKNNPLVYAGLARISRLNGNEDECLSYINKGISYLPTLSTLWLEKGILEFDQKEYNKAIVDFNKAYNFDNRNIDAYFFKYLSMLYTDRELNDIKYYWEKIVNNKIIKNWYYLYHADILLKKNHNLYAEEIIKEGLNKFPNDPYLLNMYSYFLYKKYLNSNDKNLLQEAKDNILKCISSTKKLEPEFIDTYFLILEANGESEELKKELNKYFLILPNSQIIIDWIKKFK